MSYRPVEEALHIYFYKKYFSDFSNFLFKISKKYTKKVCLTAWTRFFMYHFSMNPIRSLTEMYDFKEIYIDQLFLILNPSEKDKSRIKEHILRAIVKLQDEVRFHFPGRTWETLTSEKDDVTTITVKS